MIVNAATSKKPKIIIDLIKLEKKVQNLKTQIDTHPTLDSMVAKEDYTFLLQTKFQNSINAASITAPKQPLPW